MTKCFECGKDLPKFDVMRGLVDWHPESFCLKCLIKWNAEEKQRSISTLCEGGDPVPLFMIPDVQTPDPTEKGNKNLSRSEKGNIFRGHLIFTNKGVYFVQLYEFREKRAADLLTSDSNYTILGFILGGVVGGYIGRKIDEKVQKPSEKHQTNIQAAWKRVEEETQASKDLKALLEKGHSVLPYRKESIVSISFDSKKGLEIRATGKSPPQVFFMVTEEAYKKTEPMIKEYLAT